MNEEEKILQGVEGYRYDLMFSCNRASPRRSKLNPFQSPAMTDFQLSQLKAVTHGSLAVFMM